MNASIIVKTIRENTIRTKATIMLSSITTLLKFDNTIASQKGKIWQKQL
ncbi:hypothetical protein O6B72_02060 [Campylobacter ureolyticus]|nr:hypothetical protein [Campylobacter ureolyticus]MCZ6155604.1 hypothetical protein [Campylobacter ureolyticus]